MSSGFYKYRITLGSKSDTFEAEIPIAYTTISTLDEIVALLSNDGLVNPLELNRNSWVNISDELTQLRTCISLVPYVAKYLIMLVYVCRTKDWEQIVQLMLIIFPKLLEATSKCDDAITKLQQLKKYKIELKIELETFSMLMQHGLLKLLLDRLKPRSNITSYRIFSGIPKQYLYAGAFRNLIETHELKFITNLRKEMMDQDPRGPEVGISSVISTAALLSKLDDQTC
jgi:hypothetical protein